MSDKPFTIEGFEMNKRIEDRLAAGETIQKRWSEKTFRSGEVF